MIRFVDLGTQITGDREFAYFDTITDTFLTIDGEQTWYSFTEIDWSSEAKGLKERCAWLTPDWALAPQVEESNQVRTCQDNDTSQPAVEPQSVPVLWLRIGRDRFAHEDYPDGIYTTEPVNKTGFKSNGSPDMCDTWRVVKLERRSQWDSLSEVDQTLFRRQAVAHGIDVDAILAQMEGGRPSEDPH